MKRVLYIAYYWPPCGGIGPVRNTKFTKYFRTFGWEPVIYAPQNAQYPVTDESTLKDLPAGVEILRTPIREPYGLFNIIKGKKKDETVKDVFLIKEKEPRFMHRLGLWVRANFFIPDARVLWIKPSISYLRSYLKEHPVDAIISYGPPHSMHLIALALHKEFDIPWLSDWQDPWTEIDYYEKFPMMKSAKRQHELLEKEVLQTANEVVMVSKSWCKDLEKLSGRNVHYIPFGYDADDFEGIPYEHNTHFTITHFGTLGNDRNPMMLWETLQELIDENLIHKNDIKIHLAGQVDGSVFQSIEHYGLKDQLIYEHQINKSALFHYLRKSELLLVLINKPEGGLRYNNRGRIPAKVFECIGAQRPILVIGPPDGDVANIVRETKAGINVDYQEKDALKQHLASLYIQWKNNAVVQQNTSGEIYNFEYLCKQMSEILNNMSKH